MGNGTRLRLLKTLARGERTVSELQKLTGIAMSNISRHAAQLKRSGIISDHRSGPHVVYRLQESGIADAMKWALAVADRAVGRKHAILKSNATTRTS